MTTATMPRNRKANKPASAPAPTSDIHPAEAAGASVHNAIENGITKVSDTVCETATTIGSYAFNFVKGLVKGK